jgi:hypothetical protein
LSLRSLAAHHCKIFADRGSLMLRGIRRRDGPEQLGP